MGPFRLRPVSIRHRRPALLFVLAASLFLAYPAQADVTVAFSDTIKQNVDAQTASDLQGAINSGLKKMADNGNQGAKDLLDSNQTIRIICFGEPDAESRNLRSSGGQVYGGGGETAGDFTAEGKPRPGGTAYIAIDCDKLKRVGWFGEEGDSIGRNRVWDTLLHELLHATNSSRRHTEGESTDYEGWVRDLNKVLGSEVDDAKNAPGKRERAARREERRQQKQEGQDSPEEKKADKEKGDAEKEPAPDKPKTPDQLTKEAQAIHSREVKNVEQEFADELAEIKTLKKIDDPTPEQKARQEELTEKVENGVQQKVDEVTGPAKSRFGDPRLLPYLLIIFESKMMKKVVLDEDAMTQIDPPSYPLQGQGSSSGEAAANPKVTKIRGDSRFFKGQVKGPGDLEMTDKDGNTHNLHVDKDSSFSGEVKTPNFKPVKFTFETESGKWTLKDGQWRQVSGGTTGATAPTQEPVKKLEEDRPSSQPAALAPSFGRPLKSPDTGLGESAPSLGKPSGLKETSPHGSK